MAGRSRCQESNSRIELPRPASGARVAVRFGVEPTTAIELARVRRHGLTEQAEETLNGRVPLLLVEAEVVIVDEQGLTLATMMTMKTPMTSTAAAAEAAQAAEEVASGEQVVPAGATEVVDPAVRAGVAEVLPAQDVAGRTTGAQKTEMMAVGSVSF